MIAIGYDTGDTLIAQIDNVTTDKRDEERNEIVPERDMVLYSAVDGIRRDRAPSSWTGLCG